MSELQPQFPKLPKIRWLSDALIRSEAARFLADFWPPGTVPVDIDHIIDETAGLDVIAAPNIARALGVDGFLSDDQKAIYVDSALAAGTTLHRLRFTLAHELGHWYLHRDLYDVAKYDSPEDFIQFRNALPAGERIKYEWQANEFAGLVLAPPAALKVLVADAVAHAKQQGLDPVDLSDPSHRDSLAEWVGRRLEVSGAVVVRRGSNDGLW